MRAAGTEQSHKVIGLMQQKGGVGKRTLALNLAATAALADEKVLLVDTDPQGSAFCRSAVRESAPLVGYLKDSRRIS